MGGALTAEAVDSYWRDGFLFPIRVADADRAAAWRGELEAFEARWRDDPSLPRPFVDYARANLHVVSALAARLAHDRAVLDVVESIIGPDICCWMVELIVKEPRSPKMLTIHQDLTYWGLDGADGLVTAWLALSDVTIANGAMRFVRGSHHLGQVAHRDTYGHDNLLSRGQEVEVEHDAADAVDVELAPGELSLHHGLMFHGSGPNTTDRRRIGLVMRFVSPNVAQAIGADDYAMTVRGINRSSHLRSTAVPFDDFTPAALALHAEITEAQSVPLSLGADRELSYRR